MPVHMHVAEQPAEVSSCIAEYGRSPIALLETEGLLSDHFTAVHAIHITEKAARALGKAQAMVCACPTTERNLGDGVVPASILMSEGVRISLGSDSQIQIDLLEDARELEYHLRLKQLERVVLADDTSKPSLATRLFTCATMNGAISIGSNSGALAQGTPADFFTADLDDASIAGASSEDSLANIVFSLSRSAVRDVVVGGKMIVHDGKHPDQDEIVERFRRLQARLWS
jgi:formimidoylglutamate deiminase